MGHTLGTEPSKYQQEKKSTEIPSVAASEGGVAQTYVLLAYRGCRAATGLSPCSYKVSI